MNKKSKFISLIEYELLGNFNLILVNTALGMIASMVLFFIAISRYWGDGIVNEGVFYLSLQDGNTSSLIFLVEMILIAIFSIFIWKKEFDFENKTIYRTLSLPINKWKILLGKCLVVEVFFGFYLAGQVLAIVLEWIILEVVLINRIPISLELLKSVLLNKEGQFFLPRDILTFGVLCLFILVIGLMGALYVTIKKSYGIKGIVIWITLVIGWFLLGFFIPIVKINLLRKHLILFEVTLGISFIIISFALNNYLLKKKVSV
ncbi:hypothetical protein GNF80_02310 [Clostridium perfringens]|nr:hypothetical protein [Clostridium perfringens]